MTTAPLPPRRIFRKGWRRESVPQGPQGRRPPVCRRIQRSSGPVREDQSWSASAIGAGAAQVPGTVARGEESVTFCTAVSRKGASTRAPNAICRSGTGPGCFRAAWQFGLQFQRCDWPCAPDPSTPRQGTSPRCPAWRGARRSGRCRARHRGRYRPPAQHQKPGNRLLKLLKARSDPVAARFRQTTIPC